MNDSVTCTVLWVTVQSDHTGTIKPDNAARANYHASTESYTLGYHLLVSPPRPHSRTAVNGRGSEFIGFVQPSDFIPDRFGGLLKLDREIVSGAVWSGPSGDGTDQFYEVPPNGDTSPPEFRDDDPQSGEADGFICDCDMPGICAFADQVPSGHVWRMRVNFRAFAQYNGIRCSKYLPWCTRQSYRKNGLWDAGQGECDSPITMTDDAKIWEEGQWVPGILQIHWLEAGQQARRVDGNSADQVTVQDPWSEPLWTAMYQVIKSPPNDPTWILLDDVPGDNISYDGDTPVSWDLQ